MSLVVDASVVLAWIYPDERDALADRALEAVTAHGAVVPAHWRLEVANSLSQSLRRGRIDIQERDEALADLSRLQITIDL